MKKYVSIIICVVITILLYPLCVGYGTQNYPNEYYNVYLDEKLLGTIISDKELLNYIEQNTEKMINIETVTKTYCEDDKTLDQILKDENLENYINTDSIKYYIENDKNCMDITIKDGTEIEKIYTPIGLEIEKVLTYKTDITSVEEIYSQIAKLKSFTIKGYQFTISNGDEQLYVNVTDKKIFEEAVKSFIEIYVGEKEYAAYLNETQVDIKTTGSLIENVYIEETITVKEKQIPIDNVIYTNAEDLAQFLIFGDSPVTKTYKVKKGEMITDIAFANEISNQEFLISNPKYKSVNSLIASGTEVNIKQTNPKLNVVVEKYVVQDKEIDYNVVYEYDETQYVGYQKTTQEGNDGLQRVKQREKIVNGYTAYVEPKGKEVLKTAVDKIVVKGEKPKPNVGDLYNWSWPCDSVGFSVSGYEWRIHPITGERHFHNGLDIAGMGYNAPIYAANNGTVAMIKTTWDFGNYVVIDHNNGYYTLYAHMNKFYPGLKVGDTVLRGQQIGYVGSTGQSTGPHIHFEAWKGCYFCRIDPRSLYR